MGDQVVDTYEPGTFESKWQEYWAKNNTFRAERHPGKPKYYVLDMFPYPSGAGLHVGHPEGYTATDIVARYKRMRGFDVMHPMGFDAYGLPAEQHAIATGTHPEVTTKQNIENFRKQLRSLGFAYDWDREVITTSPEYYKWTQWIFLKLFEKGLAYQSEKPVNWCQALGTVLANEEVIDGKSERGGHPVVRLPLRQWTLKITAYADRLLDGLQDLDWPETRAKQTDWIGRSEGTEIDFAVDGQSDASIRVFTTRADTLFGVTYVVLAPEHALVERITATSQRAAVDAYVAAAAGKSDLDRLSLKEKTGVATGSFAVHPLTGDKVPIWVGDYVVATYGTGAVMAVPAHDARDHEFARKYELAIREVISPTESSAKSDIAKAAFTEDGKLIASGELSGLSSEAARTRITEKLASLQRGAKRINYKLRDWVFSRQRYWGEPIPIYFPIELETPGGDPRTGAAHRIQYESPIAVAVSELPVTLPPLTDFSPTGDPVGPLAKAPQWRFFQKDGKWFARETNTMPQWAGSCWYYLRYLDPKNTSELISKSAYDAWMPVDLYVGGSEHAVLHLLYARFWHKFLFDIGVVKHEEPFTKLVHQGLILGEVENTAFKDPSGAWVSYEDVVEDPDSNGWVRKSTRELLTSVRIPDSDVEKRGAKFELKAVPGITIDSRAFKMSKSRGNVVNPDDVIREHGADTLRLYEMFMGPLEMVKPWQTSGIIGVRRFLERVYALGIRPLVDTAPDDATEKILHRSIKKVTQDIEGLRFNTSISQLMQHTRALHELETLPRRAVEITLLLVAPFAPHLAEELWQRIGHTTSIANATWPEWDEAKCLDDVIEIPVQVNGKVRGRVQVPREASAEIVLGAARAEASVAQHLVGKTIKKEIYVPGKIVTLVVA